MLLHGGSFLFFPPSHRGAERWEIAASASLPLFLPPLLIKQPFNFHNAREKGDGLIDWREKKEGEDDSESSSSPTAAAKGQNWGVELHPTQYTICCVVRIVWDHQERAPAHPDGRTGRDAKRYA